jgi:hypothetical protein
VRDLNSGAFCGCSHPLERSSQQCPRILSIRARRVPPTRTEESMGRLSPGRITNLGRSQQLRMPALGTTHHTHPSAARSPTGLPMRRRTGLRKLQVARHLAGTHCQTSGDRVVVAMSCVACPGDAASGSYSSAHVAAKIASWSAQSAGDAVLLHPRETSPT